MENRFSIQEIVKIAIGVEERGRNLYAALENKTSDRKVKEIWNYLKNQEERHRRTFAEMINAMDDYAVVEFGPSEYEKYLQALASEYIITDKLTERKIREGFDSDLQAVDFAIDIEKESILVYSAMREYIVSAKQPVIDDIIKEERVHLVDLIGLKDSLT